MFASLPNMTVAEVGLIVNSKKIGGVVALICSLIFLAGCSSDTNTATETIPTNEAGVVDDAFSGRSYVVTVLKSDETPIDCIVFTNYQTMEVQCDWDHISTEPVSDNFIDPNFKDIDDDVENNFAFQSFVKKVGKKDVTCMYFNILNPSREAGAIDCEF
jgi:hypothetical protein